MVLHSDTVTMKTASLAQNGTGKDFERNWQLVCLETQQMSAT